MQSDFGCAAENLAPQKHSVRIPVGSGCLSQILPDTCVSSPFLQTAVLQKQRGVDLPAVLIRAKILSLLLRRLQGLRLGDGLLLGCRRAVAPQAAVRPAACLAPPLSKKASPFPLWGLDKRPPIEYTDTRLARSNHFFGPLVSVR